VLNVLLRQYGAFNRGNGWWGALCPCPHDHDQPGAHFSFNPRRASLCAVKKALGLSVCQGRHGQLLIKELCHLLFIQPADYGGIFRVT